ncbi:MULTISPECIES: hypothetical protein [Glutamicibacter]|uniref:hypothetical protein n=1 Tax=Glutamicibacter TaxID=1742989 RepID=UPI003A8D75E3
MSDKPQISREDLADMTPAQIMQANKDGQLQMAKIGRQQVDINLFAKMSPSARHQALEQGLLNEIFGIDPDKKED